MQTPNISSEEFLKFLDENYLFSEEVRKDGEEPIVLEDKTYLGAIRDQIFRFEISKGEVISLSDIQPEDMTLEEFTYGDDMLESRLSAEAFQSYARRWLIVFCKRADQKSLTADEFMSIGNIFYNANIPWERYLVRIPMLEFGTQVPDAIAKCKFTMSAIKAGVTPWEFTA